MNGDVRMVMESDVAARYNPCTIMTPQTGAGTGWDCVNDTTMVNYCDE